MSTSPDLPPPARPQTPAALVIDDLPPPPKPPLFMPQSQWDVMKMTREQAQDLQRFQTEMKDYGARFAQHISQQITKVVMKIITDLEGYAPSPEELLQHCVRIHAEPTNPEEQALDFYEWKGQAILCVTVNWQLTEDHPSPTMDLQILV